MVMLQLALALPLCSAPQGVHELSGPVFHELEIRATSGFGPGGTDEGRAVAFAPDGARFFVTGFRSTGAGSSFWTLCHDAGTGALAWDAVWAGDPVEFAWPRDLCVAPGGERLWVAGFGDPPGLGQHALVQGLDASLGTELWDFMFGTPGMSWEARNLVANDDGDTVFTCFSGYQGPSSPFFDTRLAAFDGQSGEPLWLTTPTLPAEGGTLLAVDLVPGAPRIAAAGEWGKPADLGIPGNTEALVVLHRTTTGAELWSTRIDQPGDHYLGGDDVLYDVAVSPDGGAVAACGLGDALPARDFLVVLLDAADGSLLWSDAVDQGLNDLAVDCAWSPDGASLYACGELGKAFGAVAYDAATGTRRWLRTVPGSGFNDRAESISVTPDGERVIASGYVSGSSTSWDYVTVAWDAATGTEVWRARYDSGHAWDDAPTRLALAPDGLRVAVTGWSQTPVHSTDILTLTYRLLPTADSTDLGGGCPGSLGLPSLAATPAWVGAVVELELAGVPAGAPALLLAALGATPVDLFGCALVVDPAAALALPGLADGSGQAAWAVSLPQDPALAGLSIAVQAGALDAAAPPPSIAVAPGILLMLGG